MKTILGGLAAMALTGEVYLLWCVAAVGEKGMKFPDFAYLLGEIYIYGFCAAVILALCSAIVRLVCRRRRSRRMGIIRMDRDGGFYYTKK